MARAAKTTPVKRRKPRETQFGEKREVLLRGAASLFAEGGFGGVSLGDLSERLNIAKPTIYYYFKSKEAILLEIKNRAQERIFEGIAEADERGRTGLEKIELFMKSFIEVTTGDFGRCLMTINPRSLEPGSRRQLKKREQAAEDRVIQFFVQGMNDGSIRKQDITVAYQALTGMISWVAIWYKESGPITRDKMAAQLVDIMFDGLREPSPRAAPARRVKTAPGQTV